MSNPNTELSGIDGETSISAHGEALPFQEGVRILGFAIAGVLAPEGELETIAVAAQHQRRGLGALLVRALAEELRKEQVTDLILEVRASNQAALAFYRGQGFAEAGRRVRYYADPEEDALLMRLKLG
jgi:ribosomal-protein-alanine N-acetyltransferase